MITKRLKYLVDSIPKCNTLADVGCDHGYVGIEALKQGAADKVIFTDISAVCLQKARKNCPAALCGRADFVCQAGLGQIGCDVAVICGMGGLEILSILQSAKRLPNAVVLQPMRNVTDVRKFVAERYVITLDVIVLDGKFYSVIVAENAGTPTPPMTELEETFGITNISNPTEDYINYLRNEDKKLKQIMLNCDCVYCELENRRKILDEALAVALSDKRR